MRQWSTIWRQPSSSNQSTLPGLAPTCTKLSVKRVNRQAFRLRTVWSNHCRFQGSAEKVVRMRQVLPSSLRPSAAMITPSKGRCSISARFLSKRSLSGLSHPEAMSFFGRRASATPSAAPGPYVSHAAAPTARTRATRAFIVGALPLLQRHVAISRGGSPDPPRLKAHCRRCATGPETRRTHDRGLAATPRPRYRPAAMSYTNTLSRRRMNSLPPEIAGYAHVCDPALGIFSAPTVRCAFGSASTRYMVPFSPRQ